MDEDTTNITVAKDEERRGHRWITLVKIVLPMLFLGAGGVGASYVYSTAPTARMHPPQQKAPLVQTETVRRATARIVLHATGTVIPARQIALKAEVSGAIKKVHPEFITGGVFAAGDEILRINKEDYALTFVQRQSQVADAAYALKLEMGQQDVAKREWELLRGDGAAEVRDAELALRKPHLEKAEAGLAAAKAELSQARLDLDRTVVRAPFNCIIRTKNVDLGSYVSAQDQLAELVGTDEYRVQVALPVDRLQWITIPRGTSEPGASARIICGAADKSRAVRTGRVIKLCADLEEEGLMARILVSVANPLDLKSGEAISQPLLIGEYVRVEIEGSELDDVVRISRSALRDGENVWIINDDGALDIRHVEVVWRDTDTVLVRDGLRNGERIVTSALAAPVKGMKVLVRGTADSAVAVGPSHGNYD